MPWQPEPDETDVEAFADMIEGLLAPLADDIPRERLMGLAREVAMRNGEDGYDVTAAIEEWVGDYVD